MKRVRLFADFVEDGRMSMEGYASDLSSALARADRGLQIEMFRPVYRPTPLLSDGWSRRIARYIRYPLQLSAGGADVYHILDHGYAHLIWRLPPERTVVTVHDLIPILAHRGRIPRGRRHRPWLSELSARFLRRAAAIIADSRRTRDDVVSVAAVPESRIHVIPLGLSAEFRRLSQPRAAIRRKLGLPDGSIVLVTGTQFYKNHATSVEVLLALSASASRLEPRLVCMGRLAPDARKLVESHGIESLVTEIRPPDRNTAVELYNAVDCLLFPSLYEGFGLPPLEAMACGTPVVCSPNGALAEVVGDAALRADALDVEALAGAVRRILTDAQLRDALCQAGLGHVKRYDWDACASAVLGVYAQVCGAASQTSL